MAQKSGARVLLWHMARTAAQSRFDCVKHLTHLGEENLGGERFLQEVDSLVQSPIMHDGILWVAGHEEHRELGVIRLKQFSQQLAWHAFGQHNIAEQQIDVGLTLS